MCVQAAHKLQLGFRLCYCMSLLILGSTLNHIISRYEFGIPGKVDNFTPVGGP